MKHLRTGDLAELSGLSKRYYEELRQKGGGPPFVKIGRAVLYPQDGFEDWLVNRPRFTSTAQADLAELGS